MDDFIFWKLFNSLPNDITINCIMPFIQPEIMVWVNKENYIKYQSIVRKLIPDNLYENYIRYIVRLDHSFTLEKVIRENIHKWNKMKKYRYKNIVAMDYLHFIYYFAFEHESKKALEVINNIACELIGSKWHKRNGVKSIRTKWIA